MHSGKRRVPAERARHAKRLGHVGPGDPVMLIALPGSSTSSQTPPHSTTSTSTSTSTSTTSTSTNQPPSSTPPSSSSSSSSQSPSPTPGSSTPSLTLPTSTSNYPSSPAIPLSSSVTDSSSTPPTSPTPNPNSPTGAASRGLPSGAIAGIIAGGVIVGIALIVFFVRKTYLRRREKKRISWNKVPGMGGSLVTEPKFDPDTSDHPPSFTAAANAPQRNAPLSPFDFEYRGNQSMYSTPPPVQLRNMPAYAIPPPPSATYNNPAYPTQPIHSPYNYGSTTALAMTHGNPGMRMSSTLPSAGLQHVPMEVIVKCTFVPTLPDELSIITGERVFVVEQYDDGWDLCMNGRGERGMVPHECLEHAPLDQPDVGWRNVKRSSSLNLDGNRY